jgi:hypothetical protein
MPSRLAKIGRPDILGPALYGPVRDDYRKRIMQLKEHRRAHVGERVTLVFESRDTLRFQIEEMLRAEGITNDAGIQAEIDVYNELMPDADSLSATLFLEVKPGEDPRKQLHRFIGLDEHLVLHVGGASLRAAFEPGRQDEDRISAVQYVRFPLSDAARTALRAAGTKLALEIDHPNYGHRVDLPETTRAALAADYE